MKIRLFRIIRIAKEKLYFPIASYFAFFARVFLRRWKPIIIVITGSNGKTTTLHFAELLLGSKVKYSHQANSAYGIPFFILGLTRRTYSAEEWIRFFVSAPFRIFFPVPQEKLLVVEADCDRPGEGKFLADLLMPAITILLDISKTHAYRFTSEKMDMGESELQRRIAYEYGYFLEKTADSVIVNSDSELIKNETERTKATVHTVSLKDMKKYSVDFERTGFYFRNRMITLPEIFPKETYYSLAAVHNLADVLGIQAVPDFSGLSKPPGRCTLFRGIRNTRILDSTYNANLSSVISIVNTVKQIKHPRKWIVLGDMVDLGTAERQEHEALGKYLTGVNAEKLILIGNRLKRYTLPVLTRSEVPYRIEWFQKPVTALDFLKKNIIGGEFISFKGSGFLEGIIEQLLTDKKDIGRLCRREAVWRKRRREWGL